MKKNGFVATSLIYSFFLVFIAIIATLLNSYIANKTILDRYNEEITKDLNGTTNSLIIQAKNANIDGGVTLTNLINNGNFSKGLNFWNKVGSAKFTTLAYGASLKNNNNYKGSYLYQNLNTTYNNKYYYSLEYSHNSTTNLYSYFYSEKCNLSSSTFDSCNPIRLNNPSATWVKDSSIYTSDSTRTSKFIIGDSSLRYDGQTYFSNIMVLNLTASFGKGYEPNIKWVDESINYFDGTISFIKIDEIEKDTSISVKFLPFTGYTNNNITCKSSESSKMVSYIMNFTDKTLLIPVNSNIRCDVVWK